MVTKVSTAMQEDGSEAVGLVPIGTPIATFRATVPDANWLFCHGQLVSRTTYAALFAAIGTAGGAGDGSTTFGIPDLRGRFLLGRDNMGGTPANRVTEGVSGLTASALGAAGGDQRLHAHTHGVTDPGHTHAFTGNSAEAGGTGDIGGFGAVVGGGGVVSSAATSISINGAGAGGAQNVPPAIVVNWMMRVT